MIENNTTANEVLDKRNTFISQFKTQTYNKGDFLLRAHDQPQYVYFLTEGTVRMYAISKNGSELVLHIFRPYSFFPLTWALNNTPNKYYFEAMSSVVVYKIPKDKALEFIRSNPDVLFDLTCRAYRGIDALLAKTMYQMIGSAYGKVLSEILIYVKRFGEVDYNNNTHMIQTTVSEKELAAQSGLTRETVSREIKILKEKGIVMFSKNSLTIVDMKRLEQELEGVA